MSIHILTKAVKTNGKEYEGERLGMIDKFNVRTDLALEERNGLNRMM